MKKISTLLAILFIAVTVSAQDYNVNTEKSELKWNGKKVTGEHWGYMSLKDGAFTIKDNKIVKGTFTIDMTSMTCEDLEDPKWNKKLVDHLKSDDFFSVDKFPSATLQITESTAFKGNEATVKGTLTIKGITHPISFTAVKSGNMYNANIKVDRTKYEVKYGSGKFFDNLGDNMIYDDFTLDVKIAVN